MTPKQTRFIEEYLKDLNATQAAIRAGYSEKTAYSQGQRLLKNVEIQSRIQEGMDTRAERNRIDADYVLKQLFEIDQMNVAEILDDDDHLLPLKQWTRTWQRYITSVDVSELAEGSGGERRGIGLLKKIRLPNKLKNLELIGKHVGLQAWNGRVEVDKGRKSIEELVAEVVSER